MTCGVMTLGIMNHSIKTLVIKRFKIRMVRIMTASIRAFNKMTSFWEYIEFITEDTKVKHTNITTKLKWEVCTKVIKMFSK
jgi:hypothetical protein